MPTYEYECQKCHKHHEAFQSITATPLKKCPKCAGPLKRLMGGGSGFLFKGSGFYITDYRGKGYHDDKKKDTPSSSSDAKKNDTPSSSSKNKPSASSSDSSSSQKKSSDTSS